MSAEEEARPNEATPASISNFFTASDVSNRDESKKDRLKRALRNHTTENDHLLDASEERTYTEETTATDQIANDDKNKLPKLAPEPPRWRFVKEAKSTSGYSSKYAGVVVSGISSSELGAKYVAPEITREMKVRTIEHFDLVPPEEKEIEQKKLREVGKLTICEWDRETEDFVGEGRLCHHLKRSSLLDDEDETSRGNCIDPSSCTATYNLPDDSHSYLDRSMTSTGAASSNGEGSNGYNRNDFDFRDENEKPISLHSTSERLWKRYRCTLFPLFLLFVIIGAVVGKKRSSEGNDGTSVPERYVFGGSAIASPSLSPTFTPTDQTTSIPSITSLPSASPSILPSTAPSGEPSSNPTVKPSATPSFDPTLGPSASPTLGPSKLPSNSPSATPTQLSSESSSPTIMGSDEPSLSQKPSHSPTVRPSSNPSDHPITMSPSQQPIMFMGGCPEQFEPFTSYIINQKVSRNGVIYLCFSTNCGSLLYTPGLDSGQWRETWEIVGTCNGTNSPTIAPSQFPSVFPTDMPSITLIPTQQPIIFIGGCPRAFDSFASYEIGSMASSEGIVYECANLFCGSLGFVPGESSNWRDTWKEVGSCNGSFAPTSTTSTVPSIMATETPSIIPTLAPLESTLVPTVNPTSNPSKVPSSKPSKVPSHSPTKVPSPNPTVQPSNEPTKRPQTLSPTRRPTLKPVLGLTPRPTCPPQNGNFNVCIALDMSGSVCGGGTCSFCQPLSSCNSFGINQERCCNNFDNVLEFSKALVRQLGDLKTMQDFSLVHFASDAEIASTLQNANQAIKTLQRLDYTGGATNLGGGITLCQKTLDASTAGRKNFMIIVTDGDPTVPSVRPREVSLRAASEAKKKGTFVIPIFVEQIGSNDPAVALMKEISSDAQVFLTDFDSIVSLKDIVFEQVICHA